MARPWILLVDPSDATLDGARAAIERWYDVVAVDGYKDARYALSKWEAPSAVAVRLALEGADDGLELAAVLRKAVGDDVLVVVYGKPASPLRDIDKFVRKRGIDEFQQMDLRGDHLGTWIYEQLKTGALVQARKDRDAAEVVRQQERKRERDRNRPEKKASDMVSEAVDQVKHRRVHLRPGQREASWQEIMDAELNVPNLRALWDKSNGRAAYLSDAE
ncbi:MAG: hypothetical protein GY913_02235 [Proteobacteria bacterium]|nr:hypothetical protein [Pseudomonadota bacterium]MCP4915718.1 hypothetical protein [Pseudomonadota bacterium]